MGNLRIQLTRALLGLLLVICTTACSKDAKKARYLERAEKFYQAGQHEKAKIEYLNLLDLDHQNVVAFERVGSIWLEQGAPLRAIGFLAKVREFSPHNVAARVKLGLAYSYIGALSEARTEAVAVLQEQPDNPEAIVLLADSSQTPDEMAAAVQQIEKFRDKNPAAFHLASASLALRRGRIRLAEQELENTLAVDPKSPRAHAALARIYLARKNLADAGKELKVAADLSPLRSSERIAYAEFQVANNAIDKAKAAVQEITQKAPDYLPAWIFLARAAFTEKHYDQSLLFLDNVLSRDANNPDARLLQSEVLIVKGESDKALSILDALSVTYPRKAEVRYLQGRAYVATNNLLQANQALEQAVSMSPDYVPAVLLLASLNLRAGKPQAAAIAIENLRKKHPDLPQARILLADAYQAMGQFDNAASFLREQLKITPDSAADHFLLGLVLRRQKRNDEAWLEFDKSLELAPDDWRSVDQMVEMDLAEERFEAAGQRIERYLAANPKAAAGYLMQGKMDAARRDWVSAEKALGTAIEIDPSLEAAYSGLVSVYIAQKNLPLAVAQLEATLKKRPDDPRTLLALGLVCQQMKNYEKARDAYEKLLEVRPDTIAALNNLGYIYAEHLNQPDRAYELALKARSLQPADGAVADSFGWILYKRGQFQQALALLRESVIKLPDDPEVQFHLGMIAYVMDQLDVARAAFAKAAAATVDFPGREEARRRLASLEQPAAPAKTEAGRDASTLTNNLPTDTPMLMRLAESQEKKGNAAQAAATYEQAMKLNPNLAAAALKLAQLYAGPLQKPDKAMEFASKARELAPDGGSSSEAAAALGRVAFQTGNFNWAYSLLQDSARQATDITANLYDLAWASYAVGKVTDARKTMERFLKAAPNATQASDASQFLHFTALDESSASGLAAEAEVGRMLKKQPDYVPALMVQAAIQLTRNETHAAVESYLKVLQKYPGFAPAQKNLALLYAQNPEDLSKAFDLAIKARRSLPDDPDVARTLAELSFRRDEFGYAIQLFQESAKNRPLPPNDLFYLGMAQLKANQSTAGSETLRAALANGLQGDLAQQARSALARDRAKANNSTGE